MNHKEAYHSVFDANDRPIGLFASLPQHVDLDAAVRSGSYQRDFVKAYIENIDVGTVHYDVFGNLRIKLGEVRNGRCSVTNPSRTPIACDAGSAVYLPVLVNGETLRARS